MYPPLSNYNGLVSITCVKNSLQAGPIIATNEANSGMYKQSLARLCRGFVEGRLAACVCVCVCVFLKVNIERRSGYHSSCPSRRDVGMQLNNCDPFAPTGTHVSMLDDSAKCCRVVGRWHDEESFFVKKQSTEHHPNS